MNFFKDSYYSAVKLILVILMVNLTYAFKEHFINSLNIAHPYARNKLSFEDEYKLFEQEIDQGIAKQGVKSRHKRYVFLNTESNVDVGYLIVVPVTVILPAMTNLFNNWRRKRSVSPNLNYPSTEGSLFQQTQANKIYSYFDLINIPEIACQLRAICEFSADPNKYFPLSDLILNKVGNKMVESPAVDEISTSNDTVVSSLYDQYYKAADDGVSFGKGKCHQSYNTRCKYSAEKLLNMSVMKFWGNIQSQLRLKFEDDIQ